MCCFSGCVLLIHKQKRQPTVYKIHQNDLWINLSETDKGGTIKSKSFLRIDIYRQIKQ